LKTIFYVQSVISDEIYGPCYKIYEALPNNSKIIPTPYALSGCLWYYEVMNSKNIIIFEPWTSDWFEKNATTFKYWVLNATELEMPRINMKVEDYSEFIKVFFRMRPFICKEYIEKIESIHGEVYICR